MASKSLACWWKKVWVRSGDIGVNQFRVLGDDFLKRGDWKVLEHAPDLPFRTVEIHVGLEGPLAAHGQARMVGIDLARVNVEHHWPAFGQNFLRLLADQPVREQSQVSAAKEADTFAHHVSYADGKLDDAILFADAMRIPPSVAYSPMAACRRKQRRVVLVAGFHQRVKEPWCFVGGGESGGAIPEHRGSRDVLKQQPRLAHIVMKLI